jgi:hypothetical protein
LVDVPIPDSGGRVLCQKCVSNANGESAELGLPKIVPAALKDDRAAMDEALRRARDPVERTNFYIGLINKHVELGGKPSEGAKKPGEREGWTGNPCYHAELMPCYVRVLEHFGLLTARQPACRQAILRYADFTLDLLGGNPINYDKLGSVFRVEWPSRIIPVTPLTLHANSIKSQEKYTRAAKIQFDDLMRLIEKNPHGYVPVWTWNPKADKFGTVYNVVTYERGLTSFWSEGQLDVVGREQAARLVAAQARWFVFGSQLLDSLEMDNPTAIRAATHGGHTMIRNQIGVYLYDDFDSYRGLVANLVTWSASSCPPPNSADEYGVDAFRTLELSNGGSSMLRWALSIHLGSSWQESKIQKHPKDGFRLQAWNRKLQPKPTFRVGAADFGLKGEGEVLAATLSGPAFRQPSEVDVSWTANNVSLVVNRSTRIRLDYGVIHPEWIGKGNPVLQRRTNADAAETIDKDVLWDASTVEWLAVPG